MHVAYVFVFVCVVVLETITRFSVLVFSGNISHTQSVGLAGWWCKHDYRGGDHLCVLVRN